MCKVGGPRCSTDTRASLATALERQAEVDALIAERQEAGSEPTARLLRRKANVDRRAEHWRELYDSTPAGQAELVAAIDTAETDDDRDRLHAQLDAAKTLREHELEAARRYRKRSRARARNDGQRKDKPGGGDALKRGSRAVPTGPGSDAGDASGGSRSDPGSVAGRGHSDGDRVRVVLGGHTVSTSGPIPRSPRALSLAARGLPSPELHELSPESAGDFREALSGLATGNPYASSVTVYPAEDYREMRTFVADDGRAGFALRGDEIVSVFVRADSKYRGSSGALIAAAVSQGGRRLDCYDTVLPSIYAREGFVPVARVPWNDDYAPEGWDYAAYSKFNDGRPDVVLMAYDPAALDSDYDRSAGVPVADFEEAEPLMRAQLDES